MSEIVVLPTGHVKIANEVIASITSAAVLEAEGVAGMAGHLDFAGKLGRKRPSKGVTLQTEQGKVQISVAILVRGGVKIQEIAKDVQQKVKIAVETMTGFTAVEVNVHVTGLIA